MGYPNPFHRRTFCHQHDQIRHPRRRSNSFLIALFSLTATILLPTCQADAPAQQVISPPSVEHDTLPATFTENRNATTIVSRFPVPKGFKRRAYPTNSFAHYLQHFPLKPAGNKVHLFNGALKSRQDVHAAVLDIDVGKRDLQQCADAIMRLRAEFFWKEEAYDSIQFHFTNGFLADYSRWRKGNRIQVAGNQVSWYKKQEASPSYASFRQYLTMVFSYAGTLSMAKELRSKPLAQIEVGDVFIQGGSPGHAVIVVDKIVEESTGAVYILLAQSYMPAQEIHILKNKQHPSQSPWYSVSSISPQLLTPEWNFYAEDLRQY